MSHSVKHQWRSQNAKKSYAHQRETTGSSASFQIVPLFKVGTSLKGKNLHPEGANSFL